MKAGEYESWGRYPLLEPGNVINLNWRNQIPLSEETGMSFLPYGYGKSYGDSCLNEGGVLIDTKRLNHIISFDQATGLIRCESGLLLSDLLNFSVPRGWFLSSTPGTKYISVGGALANDVHGKNHHKGGTFGCHVTQFELVRSDGTSLICSREQNPEMFAATIGGMGLTGLITWVEFYLKPCPGPYIQMESIKFNSLEEFFAINESSDKDFEYTVAWVDCTATGADLGRGLFSRGNHCEFPIKKNDMISKEPIPFPLEGKFVNPLSVRLFNLMYFNKQLEKSITQVVHYNPFFYPLDAVGGWNKAYGRNGFIQYQFVIPFKNGLKNLKNILGYISIHGEPSFLTVLKTFGNIKSPGMMSFPEEGITMAIDFRMDGERTLQMAEYLDSLVIESGGKLYPAKDARMSALAFQKFYPQWTEFSNFIDPKFSSSFWRRVTRETIGKEDK